MNEATSLTGRSLIATQCLMQDTIHKIGLSLDGLVVLTELGTGDFALTPILGHSNDL